MNREKKNQCVSHLSDVLNQSELVVMTHYKGLSVSEITDLRLRMREVGAGFKVVKNSLAKLALEGTRYKHLSSSFSGPVAIAFSTDPVSAAKVSCSFSKENEKLSVLCGSLNGQELDKNQVQALASLPSLDSLRGKFLGVLNAPATRISCIVQQPGAQIARLLSAKSSQGS